MHLEVTSDLWRRTLKDKMKNLNLVWKGKVLINITLKETNEVVRYIYIYVYLYMCVWNKITVPKIHTFKCEIHDFWYIQSLQPSSVFYFRKSLPWRRYFRDINQSAEYLDRKSYSRYTKSDRNLIQMSLDINAYEFSGKFAHLWKGQELILVSAIVGL